MHDPLPYLIQIGNVCQQWSYLEYLLSQVIWHFLGLNKSVGIIVTSGKEASAKAAMACALASELKVDKDFIEQLEITKARIEKLSPARNRVVHGVFSSHPSLPNPKIEIHRGKKAGQREDIKFTEIAQLGVDIHTVAKSLTKFLQERGINTK